MQSFYLYAIGANLCFALASIVFTKYSRRVSARWMNYAKAVLAGFFFLIAITATGKWNPIAPQFVMILMLSGAVGLCVGDIFLLSSFSKIGPGRTLILFGFQPIILGTAGMLFFNQSMDLQKFWAILFFIGCLGIFSLESFKRSGSWEIKGILIALAGMTLDAIGILITRYAFDNSTQTTPMEANFYRISGAIIGFIIISRFRPIHLVAKWKELGPRSKSAVFFGSFLGTFLSLFLYFTALQKAHMASLSGVAITGPIFAAMFECIFEKRWPSMYLISAFVMFLLGLKVLVG